MKTLGLALGLLAFLGLAPAQAQQNVMVPPNAPVTPVVSGAAEGSKILKASPGALLSLYITGGAAAGYLMVFNSITVPADGAVTPIECVPIGASSYQYLNFAPQPPEWYSIGIVAVYSTTGCFTKTVSTGAFFHAFVQ